MNKSGIHLVLATLIGISTLISVTLIALCDISFKPEASKPKELQPSKTETTDYESRIPVLLYHDIDGAGPFSVSSKNIRQHFEYLKVNDIEVIPLAKMIELQNSRTKITSKKCVITFDDGYNSAYTKLLPLVKEFGYPVTLFVYTDFVYKRSSNKMTWDKLRELEQNGFDIQNHTISHPDLEALLNSSSDTRYNKLYQELLLSKKMLESQLDKKIEYIAYPYGRYNSELNDISRKIGYTRVFSTDYGSNVSHNYTYCIKRHHIKRNHNLETIEQIMQMK